MHKHVSVTIKKTKQQITAADNLRTKLMNDKQLGPLTGRQFRAAAKQLKPTKQRSFRKPRTHASLPAVPVPLGYDADVESNAGISMDLRCTRLQSRLVIHIL